MILRDWGWRDWGLQPHIGWRSNHLEIEVEESALDQPGWERQLHRAWRELAIPMEQFRFNQADRVTGETPSATPR